MNRAVFLDRDGVINATVYDRQRGVFDSPYSLDQFQLLPGAAEGIRLINDMGMLAIIVSNQPGIAKGKCSPQTMNEMTEKMKAELAAWGAHLDAIYYCFHHPEGIVDAYRAVCQCRKPKPGMLLMAAQEFAIDLKRSYMIGDSPKDIQAGRAADCKTILIDQQGSHQDLNPKPDRVAADLLEAIRGINQL